jgi:exoribonuclease R
MMRSAAKLSYQQAQAAIDGKPDDKTGPILEHHPEAALGRLCVAEARRDAASRSNSTCRSARSC